jgi:uncharacterized protein
MVNRPQSKTDQQLKEWEKDRNEAIKKLDTLKRKYPEDIASLEGRIKLIERKIGELKESQNRL